MDSWVKDAYILSYYVMISRDLCNLAITSYYLYKVTTDKQTS